METFLNNDQLLRIIHESLGARPIKHGIVIERDLLLKIVLQARTHRSRHVKLKDAGTQTVIAVENTLSDTGKRDKAIKKRKVPIVESRGLEIVEDIDEQKVHTITVE